MFSHAIVGRSAVTRALLERIELVSRSEVPVLIEGESGTGKELVARALHENGPRRAFPIVALNCGALSDSLLESELFGYHRGAFTGAHGEKPGLVEAAHRGTLFLDEVGDLSTHAQTRLLRVLQGGEVIRLGGLGPKRVDVRILSATHRCLEDEIRRGRFRQDLYYRLRVVSIRVPPLRERAGDIDALVGHFLGRYAPDAPPEVEAEAMARLAAYPWPGNVRELENEVRRAVTLHGRRGVIGPEVLSPRIRDHAAGTPRGTTLRERISRFEAIVIREALDKYEWNKTRAARALGLSRQSLIRKVSRYGLARPQAPSPGGRVRAGRAAERSGPRSC